MSGDIPTAAAVPAEPPGLPRAMQWGRLYTTANAVVAQIGKDGSLPADDDRVSAMMDALHDLDRGQWMPGLMPAPWPAAVPAEPVAYKVRHPNNPRCFYVGTEPPSPTRSDTGEADEYFGGEVTPLYAAPQATPPAPAHVPESTFGNIEATSEQQPMFWVRLCSDDTYEGPIHDARIEEVRRQSGAWSPLYLGSAPPAAPAPAPVNQELLAALRSLLRHAERVQEVMDEECGIRFRDDGPMGMARDAITRAESGAPAPAQQPLSAAETLAGWREIAPDGSNVGGGCSLDGWTSAVRWAERAHGITGGATGGSK